MDGPLREMQGVQAGRASGMRGDRGRGPGPQTGAYRKKRGSRRGFGFPVNIKVMCLPYCRLLSVQ